MSSNIKYEPLSPVYKADEEIAMDDLSSPSSPSPVASIKDECCSEKKDCNKRTMGARLCRCLAVTLMIGCMLWMITGVAFATYLGAKAHRCLHPRHMTTKEFTWSPKAVSNLELGLVAGSVSIRSCPYATNISLTVRSYASSTELLGNMVLDVSEIANGRRLVLSAPSFDWTHCQRAAYELVVPEGAQLDVKAQGIVAKMDVRASAEALRHVVLSSTAAFIDVKGSMLAGTLRVDSEVGVVKLRELKSSGVVSDVRVGYVELRGIDSTKAEVSSTLRIGRSIIAHVDAESLTHASELAHVSAYDVNANSVALRVDSGAVSLTAVPDYSGAFAARSPWGFISFGHNDLVTGVTKTKDTPAAVEGHVAAKGQGSENNAVHAHIEKPRTMSVDALYGSVHLFLANPLTKWEKEH